MNHLIYEPEQTVENGYSYRVFAYVQPDRKIVVIWQVLDEGWWQTMEDHVCEDFAHFIDVWESRWAE